MISGDTLGTARASVYWLRDHKDRRFWRVWLNTDYFSLGASVHEMKAVTDDFGSMCVVQA